MMMTASISSTPSVSGTKTFGISDSPTLRTCERVAGGEHRISTIPGNSQQSDGGRVPPRGLFRFSHTFSVVAPAAEQSGTKQIVQQLQ